jgi:hypothetical protein
MSLTKGIWDSANVDNRRMRGGAIRQSTYGYSVAYTPGVDSLFEKTNNIADAFTYLKFLVVLEFAQKRMVVSIKSAEAKDATTAAHLAASRAMKSYREAEHEPRLGNLLGCKVYDDTPANRKELRVDGEEFAPRPGRVEQLWRNAA